MIEADLSAMDRRRKCWWVVYLTSGLGPAKAQQVAQRLATSGRDILELDDFLTGDHDDEVAELTGLPHRLVFSLLQNLREDGFRERLDERLLLPEDDQYPNSRLLDANPPLPVALWAVGRRSMLDDGRPAIAVAGSRSADEHLLNVAYRLGSEAARAGWKLVSGMAAGVDSAGHQGALDAGGDTIGVMASGLDNGGRHWQPDSLDDVCIVSEFPPECPWSGPRAMQRNATIAALSDAVAVIAAGETGGSWEMAHLCLKKGKPLFVLDVSSDTAPGNQKLIRGGATPISEDDLAVALTHVEGPSQGQLF